MATTHRSDLVDKIADALTDEAYDGGMGTLSEGQFAQLVRKLAITAADVIVDHTPPRAGSRPEATTADATPHRAMAGGESSKPQRAMRRDMARDLHYVGAPGDLDAIADFLITRRGWTNEVRAERRATALQSVLAPMIRDDAAGAVHIAIAGFTADGAPMLANTARTAEERIADARIRQDRRRATDV